MARDSFERFFEWDSLADQWITSEEAFDKDFPSKPFDPRTQSVAAWVIDTVFGLPIAASDSNLGSTLPGYDIKSRDAYQMVQLSLTSELTNSKLVECYADAEGIVHFYEIGSDSISLGSDLFYSIESASRRKQVNQVMVIGYDPPPKRYNIKTGKNAVDSKKNLLTLLNDTLITDKILGITDSADRDFDRFTYPLYHVWGDLLTDINAGFNCPYFREGYIEYGKPEFDQKRFWLALEIADPAKFEEVSTYVYRIYVPWFQQSSTQVTFANTTPKHLFLNSLRTGVDGGKPNMGKLHTRKYRPQDNKAIPEICRPQDDFADDEGVELPRSGEKKFLSVRDVYIYGYKLNSVRLNYYSTDGKNRILDTDADFIVDLDTQIPEPLRLTKGTDYVVTKFGSGDADRRQKIIFITDVHPDYKDSFGFKNNTLTEATFIISGSSIYDKDNNMQHKSFRYTYDPLKEEDGVLKDAVTVIDNSNAINNEFIFPQNEGQSGYVVKKIILIYDWDNPCIAVTDENNNVTSTNLKLVEVDLYPIIIRDEPAPIANNGILLNPAEIIPDYDVNTIENLHRTPYALAHSSLEQGDVKLTLPFADADDCVTISNYIKRQLDDEVIRQTTYMMSPNAEPVLGQSIGNNGEVINSIDYSYQDGSQYMITVKGGPKWQGVSGWDTAIYQNKTEQLSLEGIITGVYADNLKCQVKVEQIGVMECINTSKRILEKGDRVSVTVYNNPVAK